MIALLAALAAVGVVATIIMVVHGWAGRLTRVVRLALCLMGAGLAWAGPARFLGYGPGLGDLIFIAGVGLHLAALYGPALWRRADGLDGAVDGRISLSLHRRPGSAGR